jgi:hypothetical protein
LSPRHLSDTAATPHFSPLNLPIPCFPYPDFGIGGWLWLVLGAPLTVPQFIMSEIQDARRLRKNRERAKSILDHAYCIDPAHPLIHLAVAMVEDDEQSAAFLRDYDLKRLPE